jgi:DNA mismatch repair ATPase MutS
MKTSQEMVNKLWDDKIHGNYVIHNLVLIPNEEEKKYIDGLKLREFSLFSNFGEKLKTYKNINKEVISSMLAKSYLLDSILSLVKFKRNNKLVFAEFHDNVKKPMISVQGVWHPCLKKDNIITNDILLGDTIPNNAIITGPNAGGKSTCVKSFLINVLLCQTICISTSSQCSMTPFYYISSQISIPDCKGHESLFQAELYRCKDNIDVIKSLKPHEFAFVTMDEIFNSTNVVEGISGAYAIAKKMSSYDNMMMIFTTHFPYLTKLAKNTKNFENWKMNVEIDEKTNHITFPYKLSKGVSKQYIALELLREKGFDKDILDEAIELKKKFL